MDADHILIAIMAIALFTWGYLDYRRVCRRMAERRTRR